MIRMKNAGFHVRRLNDAFLITISKATQAVKIYAKVWQYTNHSILKAVFVIPPQSKTPQITIIKTLSKTDNKDSVLNISKPEIFDLK